jgi:hypothetical protein
MRPREIPLPKGDILATLFDSLTSAFSPKEIQHASTTSLAEGRQLHNCRDQETCSEFKIYSKAEKD